MAKQKESLISVRSKLKNMFSSLIAVKTKHHQVTNSDEFYQVGSEGDDACKTRFKPKIKETLTEPKWRSAFTDKGRLKMGKCLSRIQSGGVHPSIRGEVWEFLLGCFDAKSTFVDRDSIRAQRRERYKKLKAECQAMAPIVGSGNFIMKARISQDGTLIVPPGDHKHSEISNGYINTESLNQPHGDLNDSHYLEGNKKITDERLIEWMKNLRQISLDVNRTDRVLTFYEYPENLAKLFNILAVYAWMDKDVGYGQGMNDLCSPMVILFEDEADAFWCFEHLMRRQRANFTFTERSVGVEKQLKGLDSVIKVIDPALHQHLESCDAGSYIYAFRMFMVLFRREFSFGDCLFLWEMMWATEYDSDIVASYQENEFFFEKNKKGEKYKKKKLKKHGFRGCSETPFSVFVVASVLESQRSHLLRETQGIDDITGVLNNLSCRLDVKKAYSEALHLQKKYRRMAKSIPKCR